MSDASAHTAPRTIEDGNEHDVPVFDGHNDPLTALRWPERSGERDVFARNTGGHIDLPRMHDGGMAGGFFSAFVPSRTAPNDFDRHGDERGHYRQPLPEPLDPDVALRHTLAMLALADRLARRTRGQA